MVADARISTGLPGHPKTKKLIKRLGSGAAWNLVCLFLWAADNRSDGDLSGLSDEDIELCVDWSGQDGAFVGALRDVGFVDGAEGELQIHDWMEHNPWAAGAEMRSAKARWNAAKRHHGIAEADRLVPEYAAIRIAASNASSTTPAEAKQEDGNAPSPSPSPSNRNEIHTPDGDAPAPKPKRAIKTPIPDDFGVTERVAKWAVQRGFDRLEDHMDSFRRKAKANNYAYADWESAFMEAVREDWAKLRGGAVNGMAPPASKPRGLVL